MSIFTDTKKYPYSPDSLFLGLDADGKEVGISTDRHAITIAGSGAGKGACLLIPNALEWPENLLVVDPKGEVASKAHRHRKSWGQKVYVIDPFKVADVPDHLRASFNPIAAIDTDSPTAREDMEVIADGLVKRSDPKHEEWYDGAASLLAGLIAYVVETAPPEHRSLAGVRSILQQPNEALYADAQAMLNASAFGGLARETGILLMTAIEADKGMEKDFLGAARRYTKWMDSPPVAEVLASSSFDLSELKTGECSLFLVLPPEYLDTHAAFLRLFVRSAIAAMMKGGAKIDRRCLFMLDEFAALGRLDVVAKGMGLMRGYGLHLWPFLQDIGQLQTIYTREGAETFFGNADAAIFFGNSDPLTLRHISQRIGNWTPNEISEAPPKKRAYSAVMDGWRGKERGQERLAVNYDNERAAHDHAMRIAGRPRMGADEVARVVGKGNGELVAGAALVFAKSGDVLKIAPLPYFDNKLPYDQSVKGRLQNARDERSGQKMLAFLGSWKLVAITVAFFVGIDLWTHGEGVATAAVFGGILGFIMMVASRFLRPAFLAIDRRYKRGLNKMFNIGR